MRMYNINMDVPSEFGGFQSLSCHVLHGFDITFVVEVVDQFMPSTTLWDQMQRLYAIWRHLYSQVSLSIY